MLIECGKIKHGIKKKKKVPNNTGRWYNKRLNTQQEEVHGKSWEEKDDGMRRARRGPIISTVLSFIRGANKNAPHCHQSWICMLTWCLPSSAPKQCFYTAVLWDIGYKWQPTVTSRLQQCCHQNITVFSLKKVYERVLYLLFSSVFCWEYSCDFVMSARHWKQLISETNPQAVTHVKCQTEPCSPSRDPRHESYCQVIKHAPPLLALASVPICSLEDLRLSGYSTTSMRRCILHV